MDKGNQVKPRAAPLECVPAIDKQADERTAVRIVVASKSRWHQKATMTIASTLGHDPMAPPRRKKGIGWVP